MQELKPICGHDDYDVLSPLNRQVLIHTFRKELKIVVIEELLAVCSAACRMLHPAAGSVQHDHVQHQRSSPRGRGEPDHPATRHKIRALINDHRRSRGALHRPVRTAARVWAATGHAAGGGCCVATGRSRGACTPRHPAGTAASAVARRQGPGSAVAGDAGSRAASPPRTGTEATPGTAKTLIVWKWPVRGFAGFIGAGARDSGGHFL